MTPGLHDFGFLGQGHYAHGTRQNYRAGCRCVPCRSANACYEAQRARAKAKGDMCTALVDAAPARAKLLELASAHVGYRQAAKLAGVGHRTVGRILSGDVVLITRRVESAILGVTKPSLAYGVRINGYKTRHYIESLLREGYDEAGLARRLGLRGGRLWFRSRVTVRNALRVRQLWRLLASLEAADERRAVR